MNDRMKNSALQSVSSAAALTYDRVRRMKRQILYPDNPNEDVRLTCSKFIHTYSNPTEREELWTSTWIPANWRPVYSWGKRPSREREGDQVLTFPLWTNIALSALSSIHPLPINGLPWRYHRTTICWLSPFTLPPPFVFALKREGWGSRSEGGYGSHLDSAICFFSVRISPYVTSSHSSQFISFRCYNQSIDTVV